MNISGRHLLVVSLTLVIVPLCFAQDRRTLSRDTVAMVGKEAITSAELIKRIEMVPFPAKQKSVQSDEMKLKALYALVAEKVLANEARRVGIHDDKITTLMYHELENLFIRDELFKREVESKAKPSEEEVFVGLNRMRWELKVISFLVRSEADGWELVKHIRTGNPDRMIGRLPASLFTELDTTKILFGGPDSAYERVAFSLGSSKVSKPFYSNNLGWSVLYLLEKNTNPQVANLNIDERRNLVQKIVKVRDAQVFGDRYSREILATKGAVADSNVFTLFANAVTALRREIDPKYYYRRGGYMITSEMVDVLIDRLRPVLDTTLINIPDGPMTLGEVLEMLRYENFISRSLDGFSFVLELNEEIKHLVANEFLAREGRRQNLQYSTSVRNDLSLWTDYWAARQLYYAARDSVTVTDEEIIQHLVKNKEFFGRNYQVNVREILCPSVQDAALILDELQHGKGFSQLASQYSIRTDWKDNGGESGFFTVLRYPELGFRAMLADTGKLQGPYKLPEGYSLFSVLGRRRTKEATVGFDTLVHNVRVRLTSEKRKQTTDRFIARLAEEQRVMINQGKLKTIKPTSIPMFAQRFMGFGGMMTAVPILLQQWDWIKEFQKKTSIAF
jgi:hypothetical protein